MCALFDEEGRGLFEARQAILGHLQQGGNPSPFDRVMATRLASQCIDFVESEIGQPEPASACIGLWQGTFQLTYLEDVPRLMDKRYGRPRQQWWLDLRPIAHVLAQPAPAEEAAG
jgi:6-phosphofructokinase 1